MRNRGLAIVVVLATALGAAVAFGQFTVPFAAASPAMQQEQRVTVDFDNAPAEEVLDWLRKSGANFVIDTTGHKGKRLTVRLKDQPLERAVAAIAEGLGLSMSKKGEVYTLSDGRGSGGPMVYRRLGEADAQKWSELGEKLGQEFGGSWQGKMSQEDWKKLGQDWEKFGQQWEKDSEAWQKFGKAFEKDSEAWKKWSEKFGKEWERLPQGEWHFREIPGGAWELKSAPDIDKHVKELYEKRLKEMPAIELRLKELPHAKILQEKGLSDADRLKIEKAMEAHREAMKQLPELKELSEADRLKIEKAMKEKGLSKADKAEIEKAMRAHKEAMKDLPKLKELNKAEIEKAMKAHREAMKSLPSVKVEVEKALKDMPSVNEELKKMRFNEFGDIGKLIESLTPEQLEKNRTRGYLTPDDLTPDQRKMLGKFEGGVTIVFEKDGKSVRFKTK